MAINNGQCAACGAAGDVHEHHIVPRADGGAELPTVYLCVPCHAAVHGRQWNPDHVALTRSGVTRAKSNGRVSGRRPALADRMREAVLASLAGGFAVAAVARLYGVSRQTIMRIREAGQGYPVAI
jgi:hypothetical protein